jgi:hypothetical protein
LTMEQIEALPLSELEKHLLHVREVIPSFVR